MNLQTYRICLYISFTLVIVGLLLQAFHALAANHFIVVGLWVISLAIVTRLLAALTSRKPKDRLTLASNLVTLTMIVVIVVVSLYRS